MIENVRAREIEDVLVREIEDRDVLVRVQDVLDRVHEVQKKVNIAAICDDDQKKHLREKEAESAQKEVFRHPTSADRLMFPQQVISLFKDYLCFSFSPCTFDGGYHRLFLKFSRIRSRVLLRILNKSHKQTILISFFGELESKSTSAYLS